MQLVVTLDGGTLDISGLSAEDRAKVRVVELPAAGTALARLIGVPVGDQLVLDLALRGPGTVQLRVVDAMGRSVLEGTRAVAAGTTRTTLPTNALRSGQYVLEARSAEQRSVVRFIKP
jgi:hypothetical protein